MATNGSNGAVLSGTSMKVLILGHKGWIGNQMCELMTRENVVWVASNARADDRHAIEKEILEHR